MSKPISSLTVCHVIVIRHQTSAKHCYERVRTSIKHSMGYPKFNVWTVRAPPNPDYMWGRNGIVRTIRHVILAPTLVCLFNRSAVQASDSMSQPSHASLLLSHLISCLGRPWSSDVSSRREVVHLS